MFVMNAAPRQVAAWKSKPRKAGAGSASGSGSLVFLLPQEVAEVPEHAREKIAILMAPGGRLHGTLLLASGPTPTGEGEVPPVGSGPRTPAPRGPRGPRGPSRGSND
jgi:hypothetical protein